MISHLTCIVRNLTPSCTNLDGSQKEGDNFLNFLQNEGGTQKGGAFPQKKGGSKPGGNYVTCPVFIALEWNFCHLNAEFFYLTN